MDYIKWADKDNWTEIRDDVISHYMPAFKQWLRNNDIYLSEDIREAFKHYYYQDGSFTTGDVRYHRLESAREAIAALYRREQWGKEQ